ncbi:hypothetical protein PFISCL1PPCAC_13259, partial [Pristionchus fissidentatus]
IAIRLPFASVALILMTLLHVNRNKFLAHPSLKILLSFHFLWTYLTCINVVADYLYTIYTLCTLRNPSDLISNQSECLYRRCYQPIFFYGNEYFTTIILTFVFLHTGALASMVMMSFERKTATIHFRTYERTSRFYGYQLTVAHFVFVCILSILYLTTYGYNEQYIAYCAMTSPRGETFTQSAAPVVLVAELWTIFTFVKMLKLNLKKFAASDKFTLSERYQISENIRMLRIMLPVVWSHTLVSCIGTVMYTIAVTSGLGTQNFPLFEDAICNSFLQGIFMPIFFFRQFKKDAQHNRGVIELNSVTGEELQTVHTAVIQAAW